MVPWYMVFYFVLQTFLPRSLLLLDFLFLITVALEHVVVYGEMSLLFCCLFKNYQLFNIHSIKEVYK